MKANSVCLVVAIVFVPTGSSWAYLINEVTVSPLLPTPATNVNLNVMMTTPGTPAFLFAPTTVVQNANHFMVDVYLASGPLTAIDTLTESAPLGMLPVGTYGYTVTLHPEMDVPFGRDMRIARGAFTVVPEPATLMLAVAGAMISLMVRRSL